ncbi:MAG: PD-(D/E)XK nuclease family protein [Nitrosospira sp.]|nr:PD-(D/E)XK nuclease family protein [Nitrosospira sp.]
MSSIPDFPQVTLPEIFSTLAAGINAGVTVITPNRRLAVALKREFDQSQATKGIPVWESADILPVLAFVERLYVDVPYSGKAFPLPTLLTPAQEQVLWEDAIKRSDRGAVLLAVPEAARLAREAWELAHAWHLISGIRNFPLNENARAFQNWLQCYEHLTSRAHQVDHARLCNVVTGLCEHPEVSKPKRLVCYGFDIVTPQQAALLIKLEETGCEVMMAGPQPRLGPSGWGQRPVRVPCDNRDDEVYRAAVWARARIEAGGSSRVGVVVPGFSEYRSTIMRIFGSVMEPDARQALPGAAQRVLPFNASLGRPLLSYPLVSSAIAILELGGGETEFERASLLLRSPFLGGGETEMLHRARLDAQLRKRAEPGVTLQGLLNLILGEQRDTSYPALTQRLSAYIQFLQARPSGSQAPSLMARAMSEALQVIGFPGERELDSAEYQTLKKWQEVLANFAALDLVLSRVSYREAVSRLRHMAAETMFQPETPDVPIQILGVFDAAGMAFDYLWVMGLSDEAWPPHSRPNPFLPMELQRAAKVPQGSAAASLELASRLTDAWLSSANEVILSHPRQGVGRDASEFAPSPLIADIAAGELVLAAYPHYRNLIRDARRLECIEDHTAPALPRATGWIGGANSGTTTAGGMAVIKDHSACPFRAMAVHRFGARVVDTARSGLDAMERGILVHHMLAQAWSQLKTKSRLDAIGDEDLEAMLMQAAEEAVARVNQDRPGKLSGRLAVIEQRRLIRLAREWLDVDKKRDDFTVTAIEDKRSIEIGGLKLATRLDRIDELGDGRRIVIDYKTRAPSLNTMLGERPEEPQLPLYLVAAEPDAVAVAFGQVKAGEMRYAALARDSDLLPGAKAFSASLQVARYGSWEELVAQWRIGLERIAESFLSGHAKVDPKNYPHTCRNCDVRPLCRIYERVGSKFTGRGDEE